MTRTWSLSGGWRPFTCEREGEQFTNRALVAWSAGKQRLDEQQRKTWLTRLLHQLAAIQRKLNPRRYQQRACVEQRLRNVQEGNPARQVVAVTLTGEDGQLSLTFRSDRQRLAAAQGGRPLRHRHQRRLSGC